jgi:hypothetical protein
MRILFSLEVRRDGRPGPGRAKSGRVFEKRNSALRSPQGRTRFGLTATPHPEPLTPNPEPPATGIAPSANFGQTNNCGGSVPARGSCPINVTFSPTAAGSLAGALTITDNTKGVAGSTQTVTLSGTGTNLVVH